MDIADHVADLARELAGNYRAFDSFAMGGNAREIVADAPNSWCIVYTSNRDADAVTRSNARVFARELAPFLADSCAYDGGDIATFGASHWACGHVDGYLIRVYAADGTVTPAFACYAALATALADYPVLDESDWSDEESAGALQTWANCYNDAERVAHLREHWDTYRANIHDMAHLVAVVRGEDAPSGNCGFELYYDGN